MPAEIDLEEIKKLMPDIVRVISDSNPTYPPNYQSIDEKNKYLISNLCVFEGRDVVDIGCNFGLYSFLMSKFARSVTGLELSTAEYGSACAVKNFLEEKGFNLQNLVFENKSANSLIETTADAALISLVLYHFDDSTVDIVQNFLKKQCSTVVVQTRPARARLFSSGKLTDHVSRTTRYDGLCDVDSVISFLNDSGFDKIRIETNSHLYYGEVFPVLIGTKRNNHISQ